MWIFGIQCIYQGMNPQYRAIIIDYTTDKIIWRDNAAYDKSQNALFAADKKCQAMYEEKREKENIY